MGVVSEGRGRGSTVFFEIPLYKSELEHRPSSNRQLKPFPLGMAESTRKKSYMSLIQYTPGAPILGDELGTLADPQLSDPPASDNELRRLFTPSRTESSPAPQSTSL